MSEDLRQERSVIAAPARDRSIFRLWIIPASLLFHMLLAALFFVQWPSKELNAAPEEVVSLEIVPEPPPEAQAEEEPEPEPEASPEQEEAAAAVDETAQEAPPEPSILPDIAIRPDVETQLDAIDTPEQASSPQPATEEPREPQGFGEAASQDGELPVGEVAPVPVAKPSEEESEQPLEEREPLANEVIEQSGLRQILGELSPRRRLNQICTIEAISQIRASSADYASVRGVIPASDEGLVIEGGKLTARGGAFNLGAGRWVEIEFDCLADLETYRVQHFSQRIGKELSQAEIKARGFDRFQ